MSIQKKEYELSVWYETLGENGQKIEKKQYIIGAHDMTYIGRATGIHFKKKINGTHELTFQMPDKFFDSKLGRYVKNEYAMNMFNESKLKLHYKEKWYEFYIKSVQDDKQYKSYMKKYTCSDAFIDELSRNGYNIIFDTELYNNVEEIGTFTEIILEDSIWEYEPAYNWGDFTEYLEEKLFKIPISIFGGNIKAHKLTYQITNAKEEIKNVFTKHRRPIEMGDDLAREKEYFWDGKGTNNETFMPLIGNETQDVPNDGYIYVLYSCLDFCYQTTKTGLTATEEVQYYEDKSYALAPNSVDPNALIQFIALPSKAEIEVDESGLIVDKKYNYVITVKEWNDMLKNSSKYFYQFMPIGTDKSKKLISNEDANKLNPAVIAATGNWCVYYEGYLDQVGGLPVNNGKKISISNRTAINITPEIDQYVTVYNNNSSEYQDYYVNPDGNWKDVVGDENFNQSYRVCSKIATRQIVPQLARNLIQNGIEINSTDGWEMQALASGATDSSGTLNFKKPDTNSVSGAINYTPSTVKEYTNYTYNVFNTVINFGIVAQEKEIVTDHYYCLGLKGKFIDRSSQETITIRIGEGGIVSNGEYTLKNDNNELFSIDITADENSSEIATFYLLKFKKNIKNPYIAFTINSSFDIQQAYFFEAYTKGVDQFTGENLHYRYSGRDLFQIPTDLQSETNKEISEPLNESQVREYIIFENDVMPGDTYEYTQYFIQQVQGNTTLKENDVETSISLIADTFNSKEFLSVNGLEYKFRNTNLSVHQLPYSAKDFTDNELTIATKYIDLNKCNYYRNNTSPTECDCAYGSENADKICMYQKYGYCPYLFQSEKHCRKIRTLNGEKSNRFNLTQELSKVFEIYPVYWTEHDPMGKVKKDFIEETIDEETGTTIPAYYKMRKKLFYITEKGKENKLGFRYEKNLSNISRTIKSDQIVTKLYVQDVDSSLSKTGLCSIKTAEDNPSKDSFIINFSYYTAKGILDKNSVENDLYGSGVADMGYLKQLGHFNIEYDKLANAIINLSSESFTELEANVQVNFEGIETAQKQLNKIQKQMDRYKSDIDRPNTEMTEDEWQQYWFEAQSQTYKNYQTKYEEQQAILNGLIKELLCDENNNFEFENKPEYVYPEDYTHFFDNLSVADFKESIFVKNHTYSYGMLGQYNKEYLQIEEWKKQQAAYLKEINKLTLKFYRKYEPYLKEGTWSDGNYLTDNAYYFGAKEVAAQGAIPKVEYNISTVELEALPEYEDYEFDIADTTYTEDIGMFGINKITGLPNRLKVLISEINYNLDEPSKNSINVQNFTTQFEDLFQQVTASVQSLSFNENIYKRASNFTSNQNVSENSLQGTLDNNNVTLLNTSENNIELDKDGQAGSDINNHSNKYKLNGQGLFFSNNGGQSWNVGVGPNGINADYIKVGSLDAGKIRIVDNDYLYFYWDKEGIIALRDPKSIDDNQRLDFNNFASFNKYGLSIVEDSKVRLRAGYNYNGQIGGDNGGNYQSEKLLGANLGFYLYDNNGHAIFQTNSNSQKGQNPNDIPPKSLAAQLSLQGEIYVTDQLTTALVTQYTYSHLLLKTKEEQTYNSKIFDFLGLQNIENSDHISLINYCTDYFEHGEGERNIDFYNGDEIVSIYLNKKSDKQSIIFADKYFFVVPMIIGINNVFYTITKIDGDWAEITQQWSNQTLILSNENINSNITSNVAQFLQYNASISGYDISSGNTFNVERKNIQLAQYYLLQQNNEKLYYQDKQTTQNSVGNVGDGSTIGIYINNQSINNKRDPNLDDRFRKRIFSCLKQGSNGRLDNLFTILDNGNLYIGGKMIDSANSNSPANATDYLYFDNEYEKNAIKIENGTLIIGGNDIISFFQQQINDISNEIASKGLIRHSHSIDCSKLTNANNENITRIWVRKKEPTSLAEDWTSFDIFNCTSTSETGG